MKVRLDQLVPVKEAQRSLPQLIKRLQRGERPLVLTRRSKPVAVLGALPTGEGGSK